MDPPEVIWVFWGIKMETLDFEPPAHAGLDTYFIFGIGLMGVGLVVVLILMLVRAAQLARIRAQAEVYRLSQANVPLSAGPARVVRGRVDLIGEREAPVDLSVVQRVSNHTSKNSRWHEWTEISRSVHAEPFYLVRESGEAILVEPGTNTMLADTLETELPPNMPMHRVQRADARRGEVFFAFGDLVQGAHPRAQQQGYRGAEMGWILRPGSSDKRMLLAGDLIATRYAGRISSLHKWALALGIIWILFHLLATLPFVASLAFGTAETTNNYSLSTYITRSKRSTTTHYKISAITKSGMNLEGEVPSTTYAALSRSKRPIPITNTFGAEYFSHIGELPTVSMALLWLPCVTVAILLVVAYFSYKGAYDWYDKKKLAERGGNHHWVETRTG